MAYDKSIKPSIEDCVKEACREVIEMKSGTRAETTWADLRNELKGRAN